MLKELKHTSLYSRHLQLGAKMGSFAGYSMPIQYDGIVTEHQVVRSSAGIFDVSHMGQLFVSGEKAESFLQFITINDVKKLSHGKVQYSAMCTEEGGIIDDFLVYRFENHFMVVVNAANIIRDFDWMNKYRPEGVEIENYSDEMDLIAVQGPNSKNILQSIVKNNLDELSFYNFLEEEYCDNLLTISRTGYTGELGYEIYGSKRVIPLIWDKLMDNGKKWNLIPAGLGARDTLRLEMKYCLYGIDMDETTNPFEVGLGWITKMEKGNFVGKDELVTKKENISRRLTTFEMNDRAIPRLKYSVFKEENKIGFVTSGTQSPTLKKGIGIAMVDEPHTKIGTEIYIEIRGKMKSATIVKPPFYTNGTANIL